MKEKLPRIKASEIIRALEKTGFFFPAKVEATKYIRTGKVKE
ncbi:MAG: hypothetical protein V2A65_03745 [Candidatus Omnitrophota bacterium]